MTSSSAKRTISFARFPYPLSPQHWEESLEVPTLDGKSSIKIPAGTQGGTTFRLRNRGIKDLRSGGKGDLHVEVQVEVPTKLNSEQKEKLKEFSDSIGAKNNPMQESFVEKAKRFLWLIGHIPTRVNLTCMNRYLHPCRSMEG